MQGANVDDALARYEHARCYTFVAMGLSTEMFLDAIDGQNCAWNAVVQAVGGDAHKATKVLRDYWRTTPHPRLRRIT